MCKQILRRIFMRKILKMDFRAYTTSEAGVNIEVYDKTYDIASYIYIYIS